jgi:hypothetical protein
MIDRKFGAGPDERLFEPFWQMSNNDVHRPSFCRPSGSVAERRPVQTAIGI